jgi:hypothetical protein
LMFCRFRYVRFKQGQKEDLDVVYSPPFLLLTGKCDSFLFSCPPFLVALDRVISIPTNMMNMRQQQM